MGNLFLLFMFLGLIYLCWPARWDDPVSVGAFLALLAPVALLSIVAVFLKLNPEKASEEHHDLDLVGRDHYIVLSASNNIFQGIFGIPVLVAAYFMPHPSNWLVASIGALILGFYYRDYIDCGQQVHVKAFGFFVPFYKRRKQIDTPLQLRWEYYRPHQSDGRNFPRYNLLVEGSSNPMKSVRAVSLKPSSEEQSEKCAELNRVAEKVIQRWPKSFPYVSVSTPPER